MMMMVNNVMTIVIRTSIKRTSTREMKKRKNKRVTLEWGTEAMEKQEMEAILKGVRVDGFYG
jgi:hypothetical protein